MNLFAYGSLMFPAVWQKVTGLTAPGLAATLDGHTVCRIQGQTYPALKAKTGAVASGVLYQAVPPEAVARLDAFEGTFYERAQVTVTVEDGGSKAAWVYRAAEPDHPDILPEAWEASRFARESLEGFLEDDPGFRENRRI